jgi:hypothetical protein
MGRDDRGEDVGVDAEGNVYVVGSAVTQDAPEDIWLAKLSPQGELLWTRTYDGSGKGQDFGKALAVSPDGDAYVVGRVVMEQPEPPDGGDFETDLLIARYDPDGELMWESFYDGVVDGLPYFGTAVTVLPDGSVVVAGHGWVDSGNEADVLVRYASDGTQIAAETIDPALAGGSVGVGSIAATSGGDLVLAGAMNEVEQGHSVDLWLQRRTIEGEVLWEHTHNGSATNSTDGAGDVAVDPLDRVAVAGKVTGDTLGDVWVRVYDADGEELWTATYNGPEDRSDSAAGVAFDACGYVYAHATIHYDADPSAHHFDMWTRKYAPDGTELWTSVYAGDTESRRYNYAGGMAVADDGSVLITGQSALHGEGYDIFVRKLSP